MNVPIKDRKIKVEQFRIAMAMCEVNINYSTCDLMAKALVELERLGEKFSLQDATRIRLEWETEWNEYQKQQTEKQNEKTT